jgi:hypothetical protein
MTQEGRLKAEPVARCHKVLDVWGRKISSGE